MKIKTALLGIVLSSCFALSTVADARGGGGHGGGGQSARSSGGHSYGGGFSSRSSGGQSFGSRSSSGSRGFSSKESSGYSSRGYGKSKGYGRCHSKSETSSVSSFRGRGQSGQDRDGDNGNLPRYVDRPRDLAN
ncbi:MAG: hypothetical protein AB7I18_10650 [Candidatus Berkiella sp.]